MSLFAELKQRKLVQWTLAYMAAAFALLQGIDIVAAKFGWPNSIERLLIIALCIGFFVTLLLAWYHGERGAQRVSGTELLLLALLLAIGGGLLWRFAAPLPSTSIAAASSAMGTIPTTDKSIAVLPLINESGDQDQQYFSDGLSENLIVALSQFDGLKVIGRNSSFQFRNSKDDSRTIGAKLGVATLLEGSVQRAGDAVRISAELIRAADGSTIWTQSYDRPYKDLFALQDEITQSVAGALKAKLLANDSAAAQTDRPPSGNLDAYSAYLQGNFYRARNSEADLRQAIAQYTTATRLDPRYALAWAASARAGRWLAGEFVSGTEAREVNSQARVASDTALRLDPNLATAHDSHGELLSAFDFDWNGAEAEFRRALQLEPNNNDAMEDLGVLLAARGHPEQAIELTRRSLVTDPMRATGYLLLSRYLAALGRLDEAEQAIRKAIDLQPASGIFDATLAAIEVQHGDAKAALAEAQRTLPGPWRDYALTIAQQIGTDRATANASLEHAINTQAAGMAFQIAEIYAVRRDPDKVFEWLDRAWANRDPGLQFLLVNPFILRYRDDPRFAAFCRKIGLPSTSTAKALP